MWSNEPNPALICLARALAPSRSPRSDGEGGSHDLDDDRVKAHPLRVVVHRRDGGVGAVAFGFGGELVHQHCAKKSTGPSDQWQGPRPGGVNGARDVAFGHWRRHAVAGEDLQKEVGAQPQRLVEDNGAEPRDGTDRDAEHDPALQVRRGNQSIDQPLLHCFEREPSGSGGVRRPARPRPGSELTGPSPCSSPARALHPPDSSFKCLSASTTPPRDPAGMLATSCSISVRRRAVTASTRRRPPGDRAIRTWRRSRRSVRRVD